MIIWIEAAVALVLGGVAARIWCRHWRAKKIAAARCVDRPNSHDSSAGVRNQEDRERWGDITLPKLHPLNQKEVHRLLLVVDSGGIQALSPKDRLFLDNMTILRLSC